MAPGTSNDARAVDGTATGLSMDQLMGMLSARATELMASQERLRVLLDANRLIISELTLPAVLRRIVDVAREVSAASYAALGLLDRDQNLSQFVQVGLDAEMSAVGEREWAEAVMGALADRPGPVRIPPTLNDNGVLAAPDGELLTGPDGAPAFGSFLALPVAVSGTVFGHLCFGGRHGGDFTDEDEELLLALATTAGIAIENARLYEESRHRQEWLRARADVARKLGSDDQQGSLERIADTILRLGPADVVSVVRPTPDPGQVQVVAASGAGADELLGARYPLRGSVADAAMSAGSGLIVTDPELFTETTVCPVYSRSLASVMALPLAAEQQMVGAVVVGRRTDRAGFTETDLDLAEGFSAQAAVALELAGARADQQRLVLLQDRARIARDLHDHVVQRLFAIGLSLQSVAATVPEADTGGRLVDLVEDLDATIREIRTTIFALREDNGAETGLRRAVLEVRDATTALLPQRAEVTFAGPLDTLVDSDLIADVEAVVREGLGNIIRHAEAERATVRVQVHNDELEVEITDDGRGISDPQRRSSGLGNLRRRAEQYGGALLVTSAPQQGTTLSWTIPITI